MKQKYVKPPENDFRDFYANHTGVETAKHFNISKAVVSKYARMYGIPRRSFRHKELPTELTARQLEIINGSMLGDGCLEDVDTDKSNSRFIEKHGMEQYEYLQWKCDELKPFTTEVKLGIDKAHTIDGKFVPEKKFCKIQTCRHPLFTNMEHKWYDAARTKRVPGDIKLTSLVMAVWFLDDGYNCEGQNLTIYTNGFLLDDAEYLSLKLKKAGIKKCHVRQNQESRGSKPEIYIEKSSCVDFLEMIKPHVHVGCMKYKLKGISS